VEVLEREEWLRRAEAHRQRLASRVEPHLRRREAGEKHPVHDFLFTYYSHRPAQLLRWHPGFGVRLADAPELDDTKGYDGGAVTPAFVASQRPLVASLHRLLDATARRAPTLGCFGMHEWAMVYRLPEGGARHAAWPLRLGAAGTDTVVESHRITCSHWDAFRFFTPAAAPLNSLSPGPRDRPELEQPGCLHAGMDLYKASYRLSPMVGSDLVADAFDLAWDIRVLDMRAAPYDLTGLRLDPTGEDWTPVRVETPEGKRDYAAQQEAFAARGQEIRARLVAECERLLQVG
jgi:hypothetical protein